MRSTPLAALGLAALAASAGHALAGPAYIALGDSITFGETDLRYIQSLGDQGYVSRYADILAARTGTRPEVMNLAIDGETANSFMDGTGRTPPVVNRTDVPLALQNLHYNADNLVTQSQLFTSTVADERARGNTVDTVTITLGFNELAALAALPDGVSMIPATLAAYRASYTQVLTQIRDELPNTDLHLLNYYNPFPADPTSPAAPIFNAGGAQLNATIKDLAAQFGAKYVDTFTPFVGNEAAYTYQADFPAGSMIPTPHPFGDGTVPIGDVHPNALGYDVIAAQVAATDVAGPGGPAVVPLPSALSMLGPCVGLILGGTWLHRRRSADAARSI